MASSKKPKLVPPALTVRVQCTAGHRLSGLFVIFKLVPPSGDSKPQKLARVLEATPHPGDPPLAPETLTDEQKNDAKAKASYKQAKADYDKAKAKWDEAKALYDGALDKETPPDPGDQFVAGIVNHKGYLIPVHAAYNPWYDVVSTPGRDPDAYKLIAGETYEVCLLRHPSPLVARALTRHLNHKPEAADAKFNFIAWGKLTTTVTVKAGTNNEVLLELSESASDYVPKGGARYGNWTIYRAMPHRYCPALATPVDQLLRDLGMLRYPIGGHGSPYTPMAFAANAEAEKKEEGGYDRQAQAAGARFQENVNAGQAFVLSRRELAQGGKDWAYVLGQAFDATKHAAMKWSSLSHATFMLGLIDAETTSRIEHWITHGLRKPGETLLPSVLGYGIWMLERGELALSTWSSLAETFGCQYGVKPGSSLRSLRVFAWDGAINNSVHKTGLAVDLSGGADRFPSKAFPIRYEAHWAKNEAKAKKAIAAAEAEVTKAKAKLATATTKGDAAGIAAAQEAVSKAELGLTRAQGDDADSKFNWTIRWRLYGHSSYEVFNASKRNDELAKLRSAIAAWAGLPDPSATPATPDPALPAPAALPTVPAGPPRGKLWKAFKKKFDAEGPDVEAWLDARLAPFVDAAKALLALSNDRLVDDIFRAEVTQFIPNPYESDGGTSLRKYGPKQGDAEYPAAAWANSWINLSALAYPLGIERIGPHNMDFRDQVWVRGKDHKKAQSKAWAMSGFYTVTNDEDSDFVLMLSDITASPTNAPQLKHRDTDIPIMRAGATVATYKPDQLDGQHIVAWKKAALGLDPSLRPKAGKKSNGNEDAGGAQLGLVLSASDKGKALIQAAIDMLRGQFGAKQFVVVRAGPLTVGSVLPMQLVTGSKLADQLAAALVAFDKHATATAKREADEAAAKAAEDKAAQDKAAADAAAAGKPPPKPPVKTRKQIADEKKAAEAAAAAKAKQLVTDWTIVVQPIFVKTPDAAKLTFLPEDSVVLPPGSDGGHLEWWHYQHRSAGPTWGALLEECGYSLVTMTVPLEGNAGPDGTPVHLGLGYTQAEVASSPGAFNEGPVENRDPVTPSGG